jgi:hypothetical protein
MLANEVISTLHNPTWFIDEYGIHNWKFIMELRDQHGTRIYHIHAHITPRPAYCDRGHFHLNVDGPFNFDNADSFPRYYMSLERAKLETVDFVQWRWECFRSNVCAKSSV